MRRIRKNVNPVKAFILTPRGDFCIAVFTDRSHEYIVEAMSEVAEARGYPIEIQWPHNPKRTYISSVPPKIRNLRNKLKSLQDALKYAKLSLKSAVKRTSKKNVKRQITGIRNEIRRVRRNLRKAGDTAMETLTED